MPPRFAESRNQHLAALIRFQLRTGGRLALRSTAPGAALVLAFGIFLGNGATFLQAVGEALFAGQAGIGGRPVLIGGLFLLVALDSVPRIVPQTSGWARSLPVRRRSLALSNEAALVAAQAPATMTLLLVLATLVLAGPPPRENAPEALAGSVRGLETVETPSMPDADRPPPARAIALALGLLVAPWAAARAAIALRARRGGLATVTGLTGLALAATGVLTPTLLALGLLVLTPPSDLGPTHQLERRSQRHRPRADLRWRSTVVLAVLWSLRAIGTGRVVGAYPIPAVALLLGWTFGHNNDLPLRYETAAVRLGLGVGVTLLVAQLVAKLRQRRPAWPWRHSLPESALRRATGDALLVGVAVLPLIVAGALLDPAATLAVAAAVPLWIGLGVAAASQPVRPISGAFPFAFATAGLILAALVALDARSSWLLLAATPAGLWLATSSQRDPSPVWNELGPIEGAESER